MRAIVAGVCLQLHAWSFGAFCALHALSADGQCKTFDARADGYGRSEMCGGIVLEHESAIVTIGGSAVNQDGRSASFMAPNGPSQEEVVQAAMLDAQELGMDCIEAHGTGTALGDPIEVGALHRVLQSESVVLGAIKSQMAHSEGAAGMAGLMQALLVLQHACVSPSLHLQQANSKMELQGFVVQMPSQGTCFLSVNRMQRMGVSSFGFSGTNSHAMVLGRGIATCIGELVVVSCLETSAFSWWQRSDALGAARVLGTVVSNHTLPPGSDTVWERSWPQAICCYMAHHRVGCTPVAPGTGYLQLAIAASRHSADTGDGVQINETKFKAMLFLDGLTPTIRVTAAASSVLFDSSQHDQWTRNATMAVADIPVAETRLQSKQLPVELSGQLDGLNFYASTGNDYRGEFQSVQSLCMSLDNGNFPAAAPLLFAQAAVHHQSVAPEVRCHQVASLQMSNLLLCVAVDCVSFTGSDGARVHASEGRCNDGCLLPAQSDA